MSDNCNSYIDVKHGETLDILRKERISKYWCKLK